MGGILLYVTGTTCHWLYCQVSLSYRNIPLSTCSDPSSHPASFDITDAFPSVFGVSMLAKFVHRKNASWLPMTTQNLWGRCREWDCEAPRGGITLDLPQSPSQSFWLPVNLQSHWTHVVFKPRMWKSQKAVSGSCKRQRTGLNVLCSYGTIILINVMKSSWTRWLAQGHTDDMGMPLSQQFFFPHRFQPNAKPQFL